MKKKDDTRALTVATPQAEEDLEAVMATEEDLDLEEATTEDAENK